jgi:hypothetical protein
MKARNEGVVFVTQFRWWEARQSTTKGEFVIAKGEEYRLQGQGYSPEFRELESAMYSKLLSTLLSQGWEPVGTDEHGLVITLKRLKS